MIGWDLRVTTIWFVQIFKQPTPPTSEIVSHACALQGMLLHLLHKWKFKQRFVINDVLEASSHAEAEIRKEDERRREVCFSESGGSLNGPDLFQWIAIPVEFGEAFTQWMPNALPSFSEKALLFADFRFVTSPSPNSVPTMDVRSTRGWAGQSRLTVGLTSAQVRSYNGTCSASINGGRYNLGLRGGYRPFSDSCLFRQSFFCCLRGPEQHLANLENATT